MLKVMGEVNVKLGLKTVLNRVQNACDKRIPELQCLVPRLVAVSKTKPNSMILDTYEEGQRHFGENYVQELNDKATNKEILDKCKDIKWHFIGHLQKNKINKVLSSPNLYLIETVDSQKLAANLNKAWPKFAQPDVKLRVMVQINTSGEEEKSGVEPNEVVSVVKFIREECQNLQLDGLMTIGRFGYNLEDGPNPDFICLKDCREKVSKELEIDWKDINLSMGMSDDFENAIELGSTNVRVGSLIFGHREKKQ